MKIGEGRFTAVIEQDEFAANPREDETYGLLYLKHRDFVSETGVIAKEDIAAILPIYLYSHGVQRVSTQEWYGRAHHAEWDSRQIGFIIMTKETAEKEFEGYDKQQLEGILDGEIETFDAWLSGDVYWVRVFENDELVDSCSGFFGLDSAKDFAQSEILFHKHRMPKDTGAGF